MNKIFHIPHASKYIPKRYRSEFILSNANLKKEIDIMCDIDTDKMIDTKDKIVFRYARLFCDVERFDSYEEIMNKLGMGILYTKTHDLRTLRNKPSPEIKKYYYEHHDKLNRICEEELKNGEDLLFIDVHSFASKALKYELFPDLKRPDICLGINERYNTELLNKFIFILKKFKYTYSINEPFKGCLLPNRYINDERVHGIMLEINKSIYNTEIKFQKIKKLLSEINNI